MGGVWVALAQSSSGKGVLPSPVRSAKENPRCSENLLEDECLLEGCPLGAGLRGFFLTPFLKSPMHSSEGARSGCQVAEQKLRDSDTSL